MNSLGAWRLLPTVANGHPAAVRYVRRLNETTFLPFVISVLDIQDGRLTEIAAFEAAHLVMAFGLPTSLGPPDAEHPSTASLDILGPSLAPEAPSDRSSCGT
jgi:RNA polymerase sigma-70 factor (ECF subfamily)